ncbi:MAG: MGMT family protein [Fimbriimonadaceae bacterium]
MHKPTEYNLRIEERYSPLDELWELLVSIPPGRCVSYGELGRALPHPASGYMVGRWMAQCPDGLPWWRVVGKDGHLPIHKRDPQAAVEQHRRLEEEGVSLVEGSVDMAIFAWKPE